MYQFLVETAWLIPCYALLGALLSILWLPSITRRTGPRPAGYVNTCTTLLAVLHSVALLPLTWHQPPQEFFYPWLQVANLNLTLPVEVSSLTVGALILINGLNLLAQFYAIGYMEMDWGWARFFALLALFEAGLSGLVLCNSLFFSYVILEILTLGTYLLIGFWFNQSLVVTGARDAFLTKRVGDLFLLMGVIALLPLAGTWNFTELAVWAQTAQVDPNVAALIGLALIAGPMGKCAQFPLHLWLDEAMEGPLPSTILRNSVVVASGAWVLVKLQPVLALSPITLTALVVIGATTAIGGTLIAIAQIDTKRALSYLVSAYMGLVFIAVGTQHDEAALLLVLTHAVAIALLVMSVGGVIWNSITQNLTQHGGLWSRRPVSGFSFLVGAAGLIAVPPLGGFWALLQLADGLWDDHQFGLLGVLGLVNGLTAFGLTRVFSLMFGGKPSAMTERSPEIHWPMALPMAVLLGFVLHLPLILQSLSLLPDWVIVNYPVALGLIGSSLLGCSISAFIYLGNVVPKPVKLPSPALQDFLAYDLYTAKLYKISFVLAVDLVSRFTSWCDRYVVDGIVNLVGISSIFGGEGLKYSTSGQSQFYALTILVGLSCLGVWLGWPFLSHLSLSAIATTGP
ncbi:NAD(P)H-quinone oxidoreductase subunit F [Neosynechococcus sphagnicola sy1]|uniref:NAD(P)H-quinone oxidoreductase subunit F n=1 Tax=Neosynechococcus sphagnicola sy1 TaxID=1497020 RepID=A0A098TNN2_9CYAN|nr:NAD(P)H-quinone oxidoreductase subunit F [Neosynechococcus sphagnicola]KGF73477.1 NAD(P)H-quinone oxidoreductase subunit F [Neosynechococcus sphagnicola sy1]